MAWLINQYGICLKSCFLREKPSLAVWLKASQLSGRGKSSWSVIYTSGQRIPHEATRFLCVKTCGNVKALAHRGLAVHQCQRICVCSIRLGVSKNAPSQTMNISIEKCGQSGIIEFNTYMTSTVRRASEQEGAPTPSPLSNLAFAHGARKTSGIKPQNGFPVNT